MSDQQPLQTSHPHLDVDELIHHVELPQTPISRVLDGFVAWVGNVVSWVWVLLVAVIVVNVALRYIFDRGYIVFEEMQWHLYAIGFLVGLSYCVQNDGHIRIDIFHEQFKPRTKAWIDFFGIIIFLIPYILIILIYSPQFIEYSFETGEVSDAPSGLPYRWAIKSVMFLAYLLLGIAAISRLLRATAALFGRQPVGRPQE